MITSMAMKLFGLEDPVIVLAHLLCLASAALCLIYGCINWNRGGEKEPEEIKEEAAWQVEEEKIDEKL